MIDFEDTGIGDEVLNKIERIQEEISEYENDIWILERDLHEAESEYSMMQEMWYEAQEED